MVKRILWIAAALLVVGFFYVGYTTYDAGRSGANGNVYPTDEPSGKTRRTTPANDSTRETGSDARLQSPVTYPAPANQPLANQPLDATHSGQTAQPGVVVAGSASPPATDTISPNPPNGMVFSGAGHYQLYRQGNITWRLNTDNGQSCVLFATDEEWKKPRVRRAGCGKS